MSKSQLDLDSRFLGDSSSFFSHLLSGEMIQFQLLFRQIVSRELSAASLREIAENTIANAMEQDGHPPEARGPHPDRFPLDCHGIIMIGLSRRKLCI